ncbi:hypothetical protein [Pseudactinotalea sp. Z1748]|uniref:hypothetical protein n=1 Tax=Pseudactinotalea sp. Z1748 TaxID=3413027 RepID=UPI003C7D4FC0
MARDAVTRIFAGSSGRGRGVPQRFPKAGNLLAGVGVDQLPVAMFSLIGIDPEAIDDVIDDVARMQLLSASFRPVIVLDQPRLDATRRYGYATELIIGEHAWDPDQGNWQDYATRRLNDIVRRFHVAATLDVSGEGLTPIQRMLLDALSSH